MRLHLDRKMARAGRWLPLGILPWLLRVSLGGRHVALTFHRVRKPEPGELRALLSIEHQELDAIIELLLAAYPGRRERWLSVTFDDGYEDGAAYVESRAGRFPEVDFILFVCPEKAERRVGFRWDLAELARQAGEAPGAVAAILDAPFDIDTENDREDLRRVAADVRFQLATVERLRTLAEMPNVSLGSHTNSHPRLSRLDSARARHELDRSHESFDRLFGREEHFAFPHGHGFFDAWHVKHLRALGDPTIWDTGQTTYRPEDRAAGAVLPRVIVDGPWTARGTAAVLAGRTLITRALGVRRPSR